MLKLALASHVPLIRVTTSDLVNLKRTLVAWLPDGAEVVKSDMPKIYAALKHAHYVYVISPPDDTDWERLYQNVVTLDHEASVIVVNPTAESPTFFDCGALTVPRRCLKEFIAEFAAPKDVDGLVRSLQGLTLKEAAEVCRMASHHGGAINAKTVAGVRRFYAPPERGLAHVAVDYPYYRPDEQIETWMKLDGRLFAMNGKVPAPLVPRGILLEGEPGTGKTLAAKYIARTLELPLYRLDLGAALDKYIGESESNVTAALSRVDTLAPAVLLVDEVEKLFIGDDDSGTAKRILSALLWWLQEHKSRVFTIFTSNDVSAIPPELVRPGRVDRHITLGGLDTHAARVEYVRGVCAGVKATKATTDTVVKRLSGEPLTNPAALTTWVYDQLKTFL